VAHTKHGLIATMADSPIVAQVAIGRDRLAYAELAAKELGELYQATARRPAANIVPNADHSLVAFWWSVFGYRLLLFLVCYLVSSAVVWHACA
jgi:hypothetical protein